MEFWLLKDTHFLTGCANGLLTEQYPHLGRRFITEQHIDVFGQVIDCAVMVSHRLNEQNLQIGTVACKRYSDRKNQWMTGERISLIDQYGPESGMVFSFCKKEACVCRTSVDPESVERDEYPEGR